MAAEMIDADYLNIRIEEHAHSFERERFNEEGLHTFAEDALFDIIFSALFEKFERWNGDYFSSDPFRRKNVCSFERE